ncbi:MAG: hypothetical protein J0L60_06705 [Ignavibacteria bacterium]|nr:hypothetical protein [Ignavibacteria bacterium]
MKIELIDRLENKYAEILEILEESGYDKTIKITFETKKELQSFRTGFYGQLKRTNIKIKSWVDGLSLFINKKLEVER